MFSQSAGSPMSPVMVTTLSDRDVNILELMLPYCGLKWPLQKLIWNVNGIHFDVADCARTCSMGRAMLIAGLLSSSSFTVPLMETVPRSTYENGSAFHLDAQIVKTSLFHKLGLDFPRNPIVVSPCILAARLSGHRISKNCLPDTDISEPLLIQSFCGRDLPTPF